MRLTENTQLSTLNTPYNYNSNNDVELETPYDNLVGNDLLFTEDRHSDHKESGYDADVELLDIHPTDEYVRDKRNLEVRHVQCPFLQFFKL